MAEKAEWKKSNVKVSEVYDQCVKRNQTEHLAILDRVTMTLIAFFNNR